MAYCESLQRCIEGHLKAAEGGVKVGFPPKEPEIALGRKHSPLASDLRLLFSLIEDPG